MEGLYLYCIRESDAGVGEIKSRGIDGRSRVFALSLGNLEAITSKVDLKEYASALIAKKAKEDMEWIVKHVKRHEKVIEEVMKTGNVIPMKFGTVFKSEANLVEKLGNDLAKFRRILKKIAGKEEWGVKVYVNKEKLGEELKTRHPAMKLHFAKTKKLPRGADYFQELETEESLKKVLNKEIKGASKKLFDILESYAIEATTNKVLAKEFSGKKQPMILNSAYLIKKSLVSVFRKKVVALNKDNPAFDFDFTGPWPPYNFVK